MFGDTSIAPAQNTNTNPLPTLAQLMSGGVPSAFSRDNPVGTSISGTVRSIEAVQQRDMDTNEPKFYDDGSPMMQIVIHVATDLRDQDIPGDDGVRAIYVKGKNISALRTASRVAGRDYPHVGDGLTATYSGNGEAKKRGWNAPKLYTYEIRPNAEGINAVMGNATVAAKPAAAKSASAKAQVDISQVAALHKLGKSNAEIAGFLGVAESAVARALAVGAATDDGTEF